MWKARHLTISVLSVNPRLYALSLFLVITVGAVFVIIQDGIYAVCVRSLPITCATRVHIHCARAALKVLIMFVQEEIKDFVEPA